MNQPVSHESEERLELYALGRLPASEAEAVELHLLQCEGCRDRLDEVSRSAASFREALREEPAASRSSGRQQPWFGWLWQPRFAMAGSLAAVLVAAGLFWLTAGTPVPAVASLQLTAMRGAMPSVAQAKQLQLALADAPATDAPFRTELVDDSGSKIWEATVAGPASPLQTKIDRRLATGDYFVRLYGASGRLLHEYGFRVR